MHPPVQDSAELQRILALPRRRWSPEQSAEIVETLTGALRTPRGTQRLLPHQAIALAEIASFGGGAFLPMPVGSGKTLVSLLAPRMLPHVKRPLLLTRASLIAKTVKEEQEYRANWVLPAFRRIESYEKIARVGAASFFRDYAPDLVICDEGHALKSRSASVTRRVWRYLTSAEGAGVPLIFMTGSPIGTSIRDTAHLSARALGARSPLPFPHDVVTEWAGALDVGLQPARVFAPGALRAFASGPDECHRAAVCRRILDTPGVVSIAAPMLETPIVVRSHIAEHDTAQTEAMARLRDLGETPDGELAEDAIATWRHAREISLGFYSVWDPRPPAEWSERRRAWHSICRDVIDSNRREIDSAEQLARHLAAHPEHYPEAAEALRAWREVEPTFRANPVARWVSDATIRWVERWISSDARPALIWTDRPAFGERVRALLGLPYYGEEGVDVATGRVIGDERRTCVVSAGACGTGHNLQAFSRNLFLTIARQPIAWEQRIGRTHRPGQTADRVDVDVLFGVREDVAAFAAAQEYAANVAILTGQQQKLSAADCSSVIAPEDIEDRPEPRWRRPRKISLHGE